MKGGRPSCAYVIDRIDPSSQPHFSVGIWTTKHGGRSSRPIDIVDVNSTTVSGIRLDSKLRDRSAVQLFNSPLEMLGHPWIEQKGRFAVITKFIVTAIVRNERGDPNWGRIFGAGDEASLNDISWVKRWAGHQRVVTCIF